MAIVSCHRDDANLNQSPNISEFKDEWEDLQREIDHYNTIIEWDEMWDIETAKRWFKKGHRLFLFKQENIQKCKKCQRFSINGRLYCIRGLG